MSYKQTVAELDVVLFHDVCFISSNNKKKGIFFFSASRIFKLAAAAHCWKVEGLREAQQQELVCVGGGNNRSGNKSSGGAGWGGGGVCGRAASHTHISLFSSEGYTTILP